MKLEKIMTRENLLKAGFKDVIEDGKKIMMYRCKGDNVIAYFRFKSKLYQKAYFRFKGNLYQRARKLG
jgi:hypothetical protein